MNMEEASSTKRSNGSTSSSVVSSIPAPRAAIDTATSGDATSLVERIGAVVHQARRARELSVERLAKLAGVSAGSLSQLERGMGNPSITMLESIATALGTSVARLIDFASPPAEVTRKNERPPARGASGHLAADGDSYTLLAGGPDHMLEAIWVETQPGHSTEESPYVHAGEEFGIVLQGRKEVHVGEHFYELAPGDSIIFSSTQPHWYRNVGDEPVISIWVTTSPSV